MTQKLTVLYTNDIHSHFEKMPKIATALHQLRQKHRLDRVLTIDIGDHLDRMMMETEGTGGRANVEVMNASGYEAFVFGNNEGLTFTPDMTSSIFSQYAQFPVIGSNIIDTQSRQKPAWMEPYSIIEKNGLRIGLIGVTIDFNLFYEMLGWHIKNPFETVRSLVQKLRSNVDLLFVMSHLGLPRDRELARRIKGIDCIFGAHTHHLLEEPLLESSTGTYICAAGKFGDYVGELELTFDPKQKRIVSITGTCHDTDRFTNDVQVQKLITDYAKEAEANLNETVAILNEPLNISWTSESTLGNLLADGLKRWTNAEIGLVNSGQILQSLQKGPVTKKRLLEICPSPINPCRMTLSGKQIRKTLEESLVTEFVQLPIRGFGFRGHVLGVICLSGATVTYDLNRPDYEKIIAINIDDTELKLDQEYTVGTIDMFTFGLGYLALQEGRNVKFYLPEFIRHIIAKELGASASIERSKRATWIEQRE